MIPIPLRVCADCQTDFLPRVFSPGARYFPVTRCPRCEVERLQLVSGVITSIMDMAAEFSEQALDSEQAERQLHAARILGEFAEDIAGGVPPELVEWAARGGQLEGDDGAGDERLRDLSDLGGAAPFDDVPPTTA